MKPSGLHAVLLMSLLGLTACGGGGGGGGSPPAPNTAPIANFAFACTDLACTFTNTSSDTDDGDTIAGVTWSFGDGSANVTTLNAQHAYTAGATYTVTMTAVDTHNASASTTKSVTVAAAAAPPAAVPHASFTAACIALDCTFTDASTFDTGSVFQSRSWDLGDSSTVAATSPLAHHYAVSALTTFVVKLTVTDAAGHSSTTTQTLSVAPPTTSLNCVGGGNCTLQLTTAAKVTATMVSNSCGARGNQFLIIAPITETLFADGCYTAPGTVVNLNGGAQFAAGTVLQVEVRSGLSGTSALTFPPAIRVTGDFASGWTIVFDDGFGGLGEPDFNDLVILIKATP